MIKESGSAKRLQYRKNRPDYYTEYYFPQPNCGNYEGKPIGIHKSSSIFAIFITGATLGSIIFA